MEQDKIDVSRATPVPEGSMSPRPAPARRGAPLWLQIILSLIVIAIALCIAGLFLPTANNMVKRLGISLPLLTGSAEATAGAAPGAQPQAGGQGRQGGAGGAPGGQGGGGGYANRTAVVVAVPASTGTVNNQLSAIGDSSAVRSVTVNPQSAGTLMTVDVKPGDKVTAGQKLATLDSDTQQNALDRAKVALNDADSTLSRTQALAKSNAVPASQLDAAQLADDNAKLAVQAAQIAFDQRTITAPIDGTIGIIQVSAGNLITTTTAVTTIEDSSQILINFWVPERYSSQIVLGMPVTGESAGLPGKTFKGTVTAIDNKIDPDSRTLQLQATIPNPDGVIKSGMSFSVDMAFPGETFAAVDPLAIQWSSQGAYVWKVINNKVQKGMVTIVQRNTNGVLVTGNVKPGDSIVTQGVLQLNDNTPVRLLDNGSAPQGSSASAGQAGATSGASALRKGPPPPASGAARAGTAPAATASGSGAAAPDASAAAAPAAAAAPSAPAATGAGDASAQLAPAAGTSAAGG